MLARADSDGHVIIDLQAMLNHRKNDASCELKDEHVYVNNQKKLRKFTQGWDLEVSWQDGTTDQLPLEDLKKSNPVEVAEHSSARNIDNEVVFKWWVPYVLKKREVITSQVTSRVSRTNHKHGIDAHASMTHAAKIGSRNKNTF